MSEIENGTPAAFTAVTMRLHDVSRGDVHSTDAVTVFHGGDVSRVLGVRVGACGMWEVAQADGEGGEVSSVYGDSVETLIAALKSMQAVSLILKTEHEQ